MISCSLLNGKSMEVKFPFLSTVNDFFFSKIYSQSDELTMIRKSISTKKDFSPTLKV